jgi:hypothetical protein
LKGVVAPVVVIDFVPSHTVGQYIRQEAPLVLLIKFDYFYLVLAQV